MLRLLLAAMTPADYLRSLGLQPYDWQEEVLEYHPRDRVLLMCARQSGKTTIVGGKKGYNCKFHRGRLNLIVAPSQDQSKIAMKAVETFIGMDSELPALRYNNTFEKEFEESGSRIVALPGSERSTRGYSNPILGFFDEAARILDSTYLAARPWFTDSDGHIVAATTPWFKDGWFYRAWTNQDNRWRKILVRVRWDPTDRMTLKEHMPEDEFKAYWAEKGVSAYYSPRHTKEWCQEELQEHGELSFRREYCCEFLDDQFGLFRLSDIMGAFKEDVKTITGDTSSSVSGNKVEALRF